MPEPFRQILKRQVPLSMTFKIQIYPFLLKNLEFS